MSFIILLFFIRLYARITQDSKLLKWLFLGQKTHHLFLTGKHKNSVQVYSRLLPLKIWSHAFERWRIDMRTLYVILANARKEFAPSHICYRSSAPSVSKVTSAFTETFVALLHGDIMVELTIEIRLHCPSTFLRETHRIFAFQIAFLLFR